MMIIWFNRNILWIVLAIATVFGYFWLSSHKQKLRIGEGAALLLAVVHTLVGVICVKVFAFLEGGGPGSMSLFGAVFFMPVFYFVAAKLTKRSVADVFDIFVMLIIFTLMCSRLNCLAAGCCLGSLIPGTEALRWPNRQMEIGFYLVLLIFLGRKVGKRQYTGKIYPMYMMAYGVFRFLVEWLRESENLVGFFHISHIWALVSIGVGAYIYCKLSEVKQNDSKRRKAEKPQSRRAKEEMYE